MKKEELKPYCHFCGAGIGELSEVREVSVTSIYDCETCCKNYCDLCSYEEVQDDGVKVQKCLRCDGIIKKVC